MMKPQPGPVIGGIVGLLAIVGLAVTLVAPSSSGTTLERRVDELFARDGEGQYRDTPKQLEELQAVQKDPHFADLPPRQRDRVYLRARELAAYADFAAAADRLPDTKDVASPEQLRDLKKRLDQVKVLPEYQAQWERTEAGRRYRTVLDDFTAVEKAADELQKDYKAVAKEGEDVLRNRNAPWLPQRAKAVLEKTAKLPTPEKDKDRPLPGSERLTYATIFRFPSVAEARGAWEKVRDRLKPLAVE